MEPYTIYTITTLLFLVFCTAYAVNCVKKIRKRGFILVMKTLVSDLLFIVGALLIVFGLWQFSQPVGLIAAGILALLLWLVTAPQEDEK